MDITRTFDGAELNTEYLFGLFANLAATPDAFTLLGYPTGYEITHFAASQNIASASTRYALPTSYPPSLNMTPPSSPLTLQSPPNSFNFTFPILPTLTLPIQIDTWNAFTPTGQISQYDATFKWWQWTVDYLLSTAASASNMTLPQITAYATQKLAASICETAMTYCNSSVVPDRGELYASKAECETFLTTEVRFGEAYELGGFAHPSPSPPNDALCGYRLISNDRAKQTGRNTLLCRMVHQNMVPFRPAVHCPHIGPTGGGYCDDDKTYAQTVMQDYFTNYPFVDAVGVTGGSDRGTE